MSGVIDSVMNHLGDDQVAAIASRLQIDSGQARTAIEQALPLLVAGMARNSSTPTGAAALHGALERDHAGVDLGGLLGGLLGGGGASSGSGGLLGGLMGGGAGSGSGGLGEMLGGILGAGGNNAAGGGIGGAILGHVFGARRDQAEQGLGHTTGLGSQGAAQLLAMLAPIVMGVLGNTMRQRNLGPGDLGGLLGKDADHARNRGGATGGLLGAVLDRDGDGDVDLSDLMSLGGSLFGNRARS